jgi:hypothetical protein
MIADGTIVDADINASAGIVDTKLATIATAGKVSNSATTATNANTASAIVARDGSGNFTAGTITAALTGAASANVLKAGDTMTGVLAVTAGTAALPAITPSGDPNTGIFSPGADQLAISTNGTGRLFVDNTGDVFINKTTTDDTVTGFRYGSNRINITNAGLCAFINRQGSDGSVINFARSNVDVGSISVTTIATAYNTSSDYRLKENVVPLTGAIDRLQQIPVHRFNFIADPDKTVDGFIAHEAQAVVPECVTGTKDEVDADGNPVYQGIDQSKLVPLVVAALQEALAEIETLKAKVAALEAS